MFEFLLKVWALARRYRGRLMLGVLTGIIGGLMEPLMIATVGFVYELIFPTAGTLPALPQLKWAPEIVQQWIAAARDTLTAGVQHNPGATMVIIAAVPAVMVLRGVFSYLNVYFLQWAAVRSITDLRIRLFDHIVNLSAGFFTRTSTGHLMSRIMSDTTALQNILSNATATMVKDPVTLLSLLGFLLWRHPKITLVSAIVMPLCMLPLIIYSRKIRRSSRAMQMHTAEISSVMSESLTGNRIVKAYNLEPVVVEQFRDTARKFISHYMRIVRSTELPGPMVEFVGSVGVAIVLAYLVLSTGPRPTSSEFLVVIASIFAMYRPLKNLTRLHNNLEQARAASENVFALLATQNSIPEPASPKPLHAVKADIVFDIVDFSYGEKPVLHGISFTARPGQLVALVGASGSGKSTITSLLLRFYDPERGAIRIGGTDIREVSTRDLRSQIAVVTQETVLFNQTIYRNIELGRPGATKAEIYEAAKSANAYDFILEKEKGFETVVGEKGVVLSGGQRQRIAIARALLRNAPILILDEATSSLDTESERVVQAALEQLMKGRTTICIAHRLSTIQKADLILVVENGRIVESGTHEQLISRPGIYFRLHALQ